MLPILAEVITLRAVPEVRVRQGRPWPVAMFVAGVGNDGVNDKDV